MVRRFHIGAVLAIAISAVLCGAISSAAAQSDVVGVVTEIRKGSGDVAVRVSGEGDWKPVKPLMSLRAGDQIKVAGDARAVILITGGGAKTVTAKESPFTVTPAVAETGSGSAKVVVANVAKFLARKQDEPTYLKLTSRRVPPSPNTPVIISPRQTRLLNGPVTFLWSGSESLRYAIEVIGPEGRLWSASGLPPAPVMYPSTAPALRPGARYQWKLSATGYPTITTWFELASESQVRRVQSELSQLDPKEYSGSTIALLRAGVLFTDGFYKDALDELQQNAQQYKDEPTLRFMTGHVYDQIGLKHVAAQYFDEAAALNK